MLMRSWLLSTHKPLAHALLDAAAELLDISAYPLDAVQRHMTHLQYKVRTNMGY